MIGDKFISMPKVMGDAIKVYTELGLDGHILESYIFENAVKLVDMNNEIYDKHLNTTWLQERIDIIKAINRTKL